MTNRLSVADMRDYLSRSLPLKNLNKLRGVIAELRFREHLANLGFAQRVSPGGWIARSVRDGCYAKKHIAFFPALLVPGADYPPTHREEAKQGLHAVSAKLHEIEIDCFHCTPVVEKSRNAESVRWFGQQLGLPEAQPFLDFPGAVDGFRKRERKHGFLRRSGGRTINTSSLRKDGVIDEFSKENIRIAFQNRFYSEMSDIDGLIWGKRTVYPVEIKEKTPATDKNRGDYFGLDTGPFAKLAFFAARRGNLKSLFVVREIDDVRTRNLVEWWFITFEDLANVASWGARGGGMNMQGGSSSTVLVPKSSFSRLDAPALAALLAHPQTCTYHTPATDNEIGPHSGADSIRAVRPRGIPAAGLTRTR